MPDEIGTSLADKWVDQVIERSMNDHTDTRIIAVPPDILDYPTSTDMVVREGSNVTLRCAATGTPTPSVTWRREDGNPIIQLSTHEGIKLGGSFFFFFSE